MKLVVSKPAQEIIRTLDRDAARQVLDFSAMLRSAQDQREFEDVFPGEINRLGGDFRWFARINDHCKIVMAFDHDDHKEPIALILNIIDSRPMKATGLKDRLVNASRWARSSFARRPAKATHEPQRQSLPACFRLESEERAAEVGEAEASTSKNLTDMLRLAADEQRTAAREIQSRQNLQRNPLNAFFGRKADERPSEILGPPLSAAERISRDFGNLGE